ncbi:hypothetical protein DENSPDRAFT_846387 [Dentipellis sp. KUC8613]|nr:hypothetical protein DENSPDRAFT_846387 [Dentipellis sp. KUC8613]
MCYTHSGAQKVEIAMFAGVAAPHSTWENTTARRQDTCRRGTPRDLAAHELITTTHADGIRMAYIYPHRNKVRTYNGSPRASH